MNASISFLDGTFNLIHIPLNLYGTLLQPILQVLLPHQTSEDLADDIDNLSIDKKHGFLNVSVTPVECSVVCHSNLTKHVFEPALRRLPTALANGVTVSADTYLILSVINAGMDAGSRVSELTSPLAMASIPIFFITTYYSDFILVPSKDKKIVQEALVARHFEFSEDESAYVSNNTAPYPKTPGEHNEQPASPTGSKVAELQVRTFEQLKKRKVVPYVLDDLELVQCAGREESHYVDYTHRPSMYRSNTGNGVKDTCWLDSIDARLYTSLVTVLAMHPRFLSFTLAPDDPPSMLMDKKLVSVFGSSLNGDMEVTMVPILLDLKDVPAEATGIVSGVAGALVNEMSETAPDVGRELVYLSTARASTVILSGETATKALEVLKSKLAQE